MLIHERKSEITSYEKNIHAGMKLTNELVTMFNALPLRPVQEFGQVSRMIEDLPGLLADSLPDSAPVKLFGITLKPSKVVELMELNVTPIRDRIRQLSTDDMRSLTDFSIVAKFNGKSKLFTIDEDAASKYIQENFYIYATTQKEMEIADAFTSIINGLNTLVASGLSYNFIRNASLRDVLDFTGNGEIAISLPQYKRLTS